jgi:tetratricopeptide (TPR) repeat protein
LRIPDLRTLGLCLALVAAVCAVYGQTAGHEFLLLDDDQYVSANGHVQGGLSAAGVRWAFTAFHAANWHPLTWISHMLDVELFGDWPGGHHLSSVALHAVNAVLLLLALHRMTGAFWPSALTAALFAVHPLRVESVAWVAERKDVLSGLFCMTTLLAYGAYARRPGVARYVPVFVSLALGLMAKPMLVTLPFALLLLDVWPLRRWADARASRRLILEKLPLLALAAASSAVTVLAQQSGAAVSTLQHVPFLLRVENAAVACVMYLAKTTLPVKLSYLYPHPGLDPGVPPSFHALAVAAAAALGLVTWLVLRARGRPHLAVGWFLYLGGLVPVLGLFQVGSQAFADRYAYLPLIGIYGMVAWGLRDLATRRPALLPGLKVGAPIVLVALAAASWNQVRVWRDSRSLFEHAVRVDPANFVARTSLGTLRNLAGDLEAATREYELALRVRPDHADALSALGVVRAKRGDLAGAQELLERAVSAFPSHPDAHYNLGLVLQGRGRIAEARAHYAEAARLRPGFVLAHYALGDVLAREGDRDGAAARFRRVLEIDPGHAGAREWLRRLQASSLQAR